MDEGKFERGEVWWLRAADGALDGEEFMGRPCVLLSGDYANERNSSVIVALITGKYKSGAVYPSFMLNDERRWVLCNMIRTVSKERLDRFIWKLDEPEMKRVSGALAVAMCIPTSQTIVPAPAPVVEEPEPVEEKPDINSCSVEDLMKCGCTQALARLIISYSPYKTINDLRRVPGLKSTAFGILACKVRCVPVEGDGKPKIVKPAEPPVAVKEALEVKKKVNINTASAVEINEATGLSKTVCFFITGYRKRNGPYKSVQDLLNVDRFLPYHMEKYGPMFEV